MQNARYNIDTCAVLVELNTSVWTARKLDKGTTDELVHNKRAADKGAARVNKNLLAGRQELEVITKHVASVRNHFLYQQTLPWSDTGIRLLPSVKFLDFDARVQQEEAKFWELVNEFVAVYPSLITAQAMALGDMFKREDFPSVDAVKSKFAFQVNYLPVPTAGDFRIDVGNDATKELQDRFAKFATERVDAAMQDVRTRLKEHLTRMSDRLTVDVVGSEAKPRMFHETLLDTAFELCDIVKSLNLVGDPALEKARKSLEEAICGITTQELRKDTSVRKGVKEEVDAILKNLSW